MTPTYVALAGQYKPPTRHCCEGVVCLVAEVGLGAQCVSGGPEFTDRESKVDVRSSPDPSHGAKMLGKHRTLHTKVGHM